LDHERTGALISTGEARKSGDFYNAMVSSFLAALPRIEVVMA
jgi:hypothetical protein